MDRLKDSVSTALAEGKGVCVIQTEDESASVSQKTFSNRFEADGITFEEPSVNLFSFNNPYGACKTCLGTGMIEGVDPDLVIPNRNLSVADGAVACWHGDVLGEWNRQFMKQALKLDFPVYRAVEDLTDEEFNLLWYGDPKHHVEGIVQFFNFVASNTYKIQFRVLQARYRGRELCHDCHGTRPQGCRLCEGRRQVHYRTISHAGQRLAGLLGTPQVHQSQRAGNLAQHFEGTENACRTLE